jgi:hypothetical protein
MIKRQTNNKTKLVLGLVLEKPLDERAFEIIQQRLRRVWPLAGRASAPRRHLAYDPDQRHHLAGLARPGLDLATDQQLAWASRLDHHPQPPAKGQLVGQEAAGGQSLGQGVVGGGGPRLVVDNLEHVLFPRRTLVRGLVAYKFIGWQ